MQHSSIGTLHVLWMVRAARHTHKHTHVLVCIQFMAYECGEAIDHSKYFYRIKCHRSHLCCLFYLYVSIEQHSFDSIWTKIEAAAISQFQAPEGKMNEIENSKRK